MASNYRACVQCSCIDECERMRSCDMCGRIYCMAKGCISNLLYDVTRTAVYEVDLLDGMVDVAFSTCIYCTNERAFRGATVDQAIECIREHGCPKGVTNDEIQEMINAELPCTRCADCDGDMCSLMPKVIYTGPKRPIDRLPVIYVTLCCSCAAIRGMVLLNTCKECNPDHYETCPFGSLTRITQEEGNEACGKHIHQLKVTSS